METRVFKFGGASVNSAEGVRNVLRILKKSGKTPVAVVVSAMGKTTNALENLLGHFLGGDPLPLIDEFNRIRDYHFGIISELFPGHDHPVYGETESLFDQLRGYIRKVHLYEKGHKGYDFEYDQVVSYGELISSCILFHYLGSKGIPVRLFDAREMIMTDAGFRDAGVDWEKTAAKVRDVILPWLDTATGLRVALTQGFIGACPAGDTTTLGREGSDFSAAILAYVLKAPEVVIWKDVAGVLNADPKWFKNPRKLDVISYREAIELAYFGASVIHPKTIRPLENAGIRLRVKSFMNPGAAGTLITAMTRWEIRVPVYIRKPDQVLVSISPRDFSFIVEENISQIFRLLSKYRVKVNVMQNSAISFSVCIDRNERVLPELLEELSGTFEIRYNGNVELYTIRHYNPAAIRRITAGRTVLLEQRTRHTVHLLLVRNA